MAVCRTTVIDSHTGGEPTRVVVDGGPDLGEGTMQERVQQFAELHDDFRTLTILEPRGSDVWVGALLVPPAKPTSLAGVIFYNNAAYLGMCGHGTIGVMVTLHHLGRIEPGIFELDTPVGTIEAELLDAHRVSVRNVPSYRYLAGVEIRLDGYGLIKGDVAWGGNWFFLVKDFPESITLANVSRLQQLSEQIKQKLATDGITGERGAEIDHIELFGAPHDSANDGRNYVLCPGNAFDRSPCGTGTSAKLACLAADGDLEPGQIWRQESVIGSVFEASYESAGNQVIPTITGSAYVTAETTLIQYELDPFRTGIKS